MLVTGMGKQKCNLTSVTLPKAAEAEGGFWLIFLASEEMKPHKNPANFIKILSVPEILPSIYQLGTTVLQIRNNDHNYTVFTYTIRAHNAIIFLYFLFKHLRSWLYIGKLLLAREETSQNASENDSGHMWKWKWRTDERAVEKEAVEGHKKTKQTLNTTPYGEKIRFYHLDF